MEIVFSAQALEHLDWWKKTVNVKAQKKIQVLLRSIQETPFAGEGKPEPLKYIFSGAWSRRINGEHKITYEVYEEKVQIIGFKGYYE